MADETYEKEFMQFLNSRGMNETAEAFRKEMEQQQQQKQKKSPSRTGEEQQQQPKPGSSPKPHSSPKPQEEEAPQEETSSEKKDATPSSRPSSAAATATRKSVRTAEALQLEADERRAAAPKATSLPDDEPTLWGPEDLGILTFPGSEEELWDIDDFEVPKCPEYPVGAGIGKSRFLEQCTSDEETNFVDCDPYQKQHPPAGLPLESFDLRIVYEAGRTGFEEAKEFPIIVGSVIAGRYQVTEFLGSAAFSRAVQCVDLKHNVYVCMKIIRNSKDFFDQSLDEIKLLQYINTNGDADSNRVLQLFDFFYYKEHMFLVCELLRDNLYEFAKYNREQEQESYFTLVRIQSIAKQVLTALSFVHSLGLLHCDLKPENILIKSYSRCEVKVIDFGSSCFTTDNLSSYVQSRCYRAPEVVLGCKYDGRIDVWSLGCILPELMTGHVLFHNESLCGMLARITAICGPIPPRVLQEGRHTCRYVTTHGAFYERSAEDDTLTFALPVRTTLESRIGSEDADYIDFIKQMLTLDPVHRPTAAELLKHPFLTKDLGPITPA